MAQSLPPEAGVRLNRYLASCGLGSRRKCEDFVREGHIEVNGRVVVDLATRVLPEDFVRFEGRVVRPDKELTILISKPKGYLCTRHDPEGRKTIYDLLPVKFRSLAHVGRLDSESHGLLLMTNSGSVNERLTHPRHQVEKEYHVTLNRAFDPEQTQRLLDGVRLFEGIAKAESVRFFTHKRLAIVLSQGYNRQIRRMFAKLDYKVRELERIRIGSLTAPDLSTGGYRILNPRDLQLACSNPEGSAKGKEVEPKKDRRPAKRPPSRRTGSGR